MTVPAQFYEFRVAGRTRLCQRALWDKLLGPKPGDTWDGCNGCSKSPDYWRGYALWPACRIHDWHYSGEGPRVPRVVADLILRVNLWRCLRAQGCNRLSAAAIAGAYHAGVAMGGWTAYRRRR